MSFHEALLNRICPQPIIVFASSFSLSDDFDEPAHFKVNMTPLKPFHSYRIGAAPLYTCRSLRIFVKLLNLRQKLIGMSKESSIRKARNQILRTKIANLLVIVSIFW